jgi:hypothetical protein
MWFMHLVRDTQISKWNNWKLIKKTYNNVAYMHIYLLLLCLLVWSYMYISYLVVNFIALKIFELSKSSQKHVSEILIN